MKNPKYTKINQTFIITRTRRRRNKQIISKRSWKTRTTGTDREREKESLMSYVIRVGKKRTVFASFNTSRNSKPNSSDREDHLMPPIHEFFLDFNLPLALLPLSTTTKYSKRYRLEPGQTSLLYRQIQRELNKKETKSYSFAFVQMKKKGSMEELSSSSNITIKSLESPSQANVFSREKSEFISGGGMGGVFLQFYREKRAKGHRHVTDIQLRRLLF